MGANFCVFLFTVMVHMSLQKWDLLLNVIICSQGSKFFPLRVDPYIHVEGTHNYAPNFGEVEGAYWFGPLRPSVCLSVILGS